MRHDILSDAMSIIANAENVGMRFCLVPKSKIVKSVLNVMEANGIIGEVTENQDIKVELIGNVNKAGSIRPRFSVTKDDYEKFEKRYLPSRNVGFLIVSTSKGVMTQREANGKIGGKLLAYIY